MRKHGGSIAYHYESSHSHNKPVVSGIIESQKMLLLLDTGADLSIVALSEVKRCNIKAPIQKVGAAIVCYGFDEDPENPDHVKKKLMKPRASFSSRKRLVFLSFSLKTDYR